MSSNENENINYSKLSKDLSKLINKNDKKNEGIFFTPPTIINKTFKIVEPYISNIKTVLEPSCGSCEYIDLLNKKYDNHFDKVIGIEMNKTIYDKVKTLFNDTNNNNNNNIQIIKDDFLKFHNSINDYDLILGNPPFYVMKMALFKETYEDYENYCEYFDGRPNIFILFIIKSLTLLKQNTGILSFVLPKNFLNCLYYDKLRNYIYNKFTIIDIVDCYEDKFIDTQQDTILFIVQNKLPYNIINNTISDETNNETNINDKYVLKKVKNYTIFNTVENIKKLTKLYENGKTLNDLNFIVSVGNVVWNQCKSILIDEKLFKEEKNKENNKLARLIYNSDITNNKLEMASFKNEQKKHFIKKYGATDIILVINRGYGKGDYKFNYCLIDINTPYLVENHLICIKYNSKQNTEKKKEYVRTIYKKIIKSLKSDKTKQFIKLYFCNNAINTSELNNVIPFYGL